MTMHSGTNNTNDEIELDSKKLKVGEKSYYIDMKENNKGRYIKLVENLGHGKMSRIAVTVSIVNEFVTKLKEMDEYIKVHFKKDNTTSTSNQPAQIDGDIENYPTIIHSLSLFVQHKRFYFDLREHKDGYRRLRISHVLKTKRINLSMVTDAIPSLLQILEDYIDRFVSDSIQLDTSQKTENDDNNRYKVRTKRSVIKDDQSSKPHRKGALVISEKPAPIQKPIVNKIYSFEVVTGEQNSFIRMTEIIGHSKKSTFHVPLEGCIAWKDAIVEFVDQITTDDISKANALRVAAESLAQASETTKTD